MRVLITTSTYPVRLDDGTPRFVHDLAQALSAHAEVAVLAPDAPGAELAERIEAVEVRRFTYFRPRDRQRLALGAGMRDNLTGSWTARLQVPAFFLREAWATRSMVRGRGVDVVNAHWLVPQGLTAAWALGRQRRARLVLHVHAGDVYLLEKLPFGRSIARYVLARTDAVFADGSHVRDSLNRLLGYDCGAVLQPMGVHSERFGRSEQAPEVELPAEWTDGFLLFFGRLAEKKGAIYLIRALPRVCAARPGLGLVLIGDGPELDRVRREAERLGVAQRVHFLGRRPHADIVRYLHHCRAAVVPSIVDSRGETEGMPTVVVEALAAGVRVVGSAVDGIPDVLRHEENGWLCREKDPDDLAEKLLAALADPDSSTIPASARGTAARHDWQQVALNYLACFERLLGAGASRGGPAGAS